MKSRLVKYYNLARCTDAINIWFTRSCTLINSTWIHTKIHALQRCNKIPQLGLWSFWKYSFVKFGCFAMQLPLFSPFSPIKHLVFKTEAKKTKRKQPLQAGLLSWAAMTIRSSENLRRLPCWLLFFLQWIEPPTPRKSLPKILFFFFWFSSPLLPESTNPFKFGPGFFPYFPSLKNWTCSRWLARRFD